MDKGIWYESGEYIERDFRQKLDRAEYEEDQEEQEEDKEMVRVINEGNDEYSVLIEGTEVFSGLTRKEALEIQSDILADRDSDEPWYNQILNNG